MPTNPHIVVSVEPTVAVVGEKITKYLYQISDNISVYSFYYICNYKYYNMYKGICRQTAT